MGTTFKKEQLIIFCESRSSYHLIGMLLCLNDVNDQLATRILTIARDQ